MTGAGDGASDGASHRWEDRKRNSWLDGRGRLAFHDQDAAVAIKDPEERSSARSDVARDITKLKHVEEKLRRASERLELAVRSSNVALGELDLTAGPNGRVEWLNYWEQWGTGNPEDYPTADSMMSLVHPEDRDEVARHTEAFFRAAKSKNSSPSIESSIGTGPITGR